MTTMRERPIPFSGSMVRAVLGGTKTQTRRVMKPQPAHAAEWASKGFDPPCALHTDAWGNPVATHRCPYGVPGDRLWVKETWCPRIAHSHGMDACDCGDVWLTYAADGAERLVSDWDIPEHWEMPKAAERGNVSPLFMPRWASRIVLGITEVRVQRLQEISEEDARAEGCSGRDPEPAAEGGTIYAWRGRSSAPDPRAHFAALWDGLNGDRPGCSWADNPWVWAITFRKLG